MGGMTQHIDITESDIRGSLIARAKAFRETTKMSFSTMGIDAVGDSKFLSRVENPTKGFNIKTYQKMVAWLDKAERNLAVERETAQ